MVGSSPAAPITPTYPSEIDAFVINGGNHTISVVNTTTNAVTSTIPTGFGPLVGALSPDGTTGYMTNSLINDVFVVSMAPPLHLLRIVPVGRRPGSVAVTPDGKTAAVVNVASATVSLVNTTKYSKKNVAVGGTPSAVVVSPDGQSAYVSNPALDQVSVISIPTHALVGSIPDPNGPEAMAITPDGTTLYCVDADGSVSVLSTTTRTAVAVIPGLSSPSDVAVGPDGSQAFVSQSGAGSVSVISTASNTVVATVPVGNTPQGLGMAPGGADLYVTNSGDGTVDVISTANDTVVGGPVTVGADPHSVVITPDQAPVAHLSVTPAPAGTPTSLDASASTSATSPITTYRWSFGDGANAVTATPYTTHAYAAGGNETASVTETDANGTSTTQVFTGHTLVRNGGPGAVATASFVIPPPLAPTGVTATLGASSPTVPSVETVPEAALPASAVESGSPSDTSGNSSSAPLRSIPLRSIPLGSIPLRSIPLRSIPLPNPALNTAALSDIGVTYPSGCTGTACTGWPGILAGTPLAINPLQSTTLADVLSDPTASARFDTLDLSDLDLSSSPLGSIPLASIALSGTPLRSIPLPGAGTTDTDRLTAWCTLLSSIDPAEDCTALGIDPSNPSTAANVTLLSLSLAGVPLRSIPLRSIPLRSIDFSTSALASIPLRSIDIANTPLGSIPLRSIPLRSIPLGSIPLASIADLPAVVDCSGAAGGFTCPAGSTLDDALTAGAVLAAANLADLGTYDGTTLADLGSSDTTDLADLGTYGLGTSNLSSLPLRSIPLRSIPLGSITLDSLPLRSIPLGSIPLRSIPLRSIPLGSIPLASIADLPAVVDCSGAAGGFTCPAGSTLDDALLAGAILPGATLAELGTYNGTTLAQLGYYASVLMSDLGPTLSAQGVAELAAYEDAILGQLGTYDNTTLAQLLANLDDTVPGFPNLTLADVLLSLMPPGSFPWATINLNDVPLARFESAGGSVTYTAALVVTGSAGAVTGTITLPPGFAYVPGSATLDGPTIADPVVNGSTLTFVEDLTVGTHQLAVRANAGIGLGTAGASITATTASSTSSAAAPVDVVDGLQPDSTTATATPLATGNEQLGTGYLNLGYLTSTSDTNLWSVPVGQGEELALSLSNLPADYDMVLYSPLGQQLQGTPTQQAPTVIDAPPSLTPVNQPDTPTTDVPLNPPAGYQVFAVSANRGTSDENIQTPPLAAGTYYVQISGYNGASSTQPYVLRGAVLPTAADSCPGGISFPNPMPAPAPPPANVPANVNTLFLVDTQRLAAGYGPVAEGQVLTALDTVASDGADGVRGLVVPVDSDPATQNAFTTFDQDPCNVQSANAVVQAVSALVDSTRAAHPTITNLVIVGADDQIPFARIADGATQSNERDYGTSTFAGQNNVEADALSQGYYFSDDPYAAAQPLGVGSATLYLPQLAVGRLVETPTQIVSALNRFVSSHGVLDASAALSTGYSFLTSGAQLVATNLSKVSGRSVSSLISETWTHQDLDNSLTASPTPGLDSINAHFDYSRALPAIGNTTGDQSDLFTTQDIRGAPVNTYAGRLLFSMGCHSGLDVNDFEVAPSGVTTPVDDWAKTFADSGALWVGNTGFGYGDTATVAYSAKLMAGFAGRLDGSETVGAALSDAKQAYAAGGAVLSPYDLKALMESTFYGLPMYHLNSTPPQGGPTPTPLGTGTDPITGLTSAAFSVQLTEGANPGQLGQVTVGHGRYYQVNGDNPYDGATQTTEFRPIGPLTTLDVTQPSPSNPDALGLVAHGALLTGLTSNDQHPFTPVVSDPGVDSTQTTSSSPLGETVFPSQL
ncbi:MAG TPA: PKD domain-containing protein, partial [Acidimicrobiales bacterium]|nr:PKD domain-containing protein [Acidimicrobiales bacterium]